MIKILPETEPFDPEHIRVYTVSEDGVTTADPATATDPENAGSPVSFEAMQEVVFVELQLRVADPP